MTLTQTYSPEDMDAVKPIYIDSFPAEERREWTDLVSRSQTGEISFNIIKNNDEVAGLITVWHLPTVDYVEHFAMSPAMRGQGLGADVIDEIVRRALGRAVVLEVEPRGLNLMADRRIGFYQRHGFSILEYDYLQPPYSDGLPCVPLKLMSTKPVDAQSVSNELHKLVYGVNPCCGGRATFRDILD